jgi:hypothetical protein
MISLKRYFNASGEETSFAQVEAALRQTISQLVSAMGSSAVDGDPAEFSDFREEIKQIREGLAPDVVTENVMDLAESATRALTAHNKRIRPCWSARGAKSSTSSACFRTR